MLGRLGDSYVMKHLRLVPILAFVAVLAAACGSSDSAPKSVPSDAIAVVGSDTISKDEYNQVLAQAQRSYVAQKKPFPKAGTQVYGALRAQIIQFLVERSEYSQKAKDLGVKVTDKDIEDRLNQVKQQYFVNPPGQKPASKAEIDKRYQAQLKAQGLTDQDVKDGIQAQLLREKIYNEVTRTSKFRTTTPRSTTTTTSSSTRSLRSRRIASSATSSSRITRWR